jgi:hypothetical protein
MRTIPFESIIMSIVVEQGRVMRELKQRLARLEEKVYRV